MINFLYWNVNNKNITSLIAEACLENEIDVLILAEHKNIDRDYLKRLFKEKGVEFKNENIIPKTRVLLLHNTNDKIKVIRESKYYSVYKLNCNNDEILIFALHLPSKYAQDTSDLNMYTSQIIREFEQVEEELNNSKSIVIGDFNMNPFDDGMVSPFGFNAVMCPEIAKKHSRKVLGEEKRFYYNPMWHIIGNHNNTCKGTYYYTKATKSLYWYTYDQVLIRPDLIHCFSMNNLRVIENIKDRSLLVKSNIPNARDISDHLPLKFEIEMEVN